MARNLRTLTLLLTTVSLSASAFVCTSPGQHLSTFTLHKGTLYVCGDNQEQKGKLTLFFEGMAIFGAPNSTKTPTEIKLNGVLGYPTYEFSRNEGRVLIVRELLNVFSKPTPITESVITCDEKSCRQGSVTCVLKQKLPDGKKAEFSVLLNKLRTLKLKEWATLYDVDGLADYAIMGEKDAADVFLSDKLRGHVDASIGESYSETTTLLKQLKTMGCFHESSL